MKYPAKMDLVPYDWNQAIHNYRPSARQYWNAGKSLYKAGQYMWKKYFDRNSGRMKLKRARVGVHKMSTANRYLKGGWYGKKKRRFRRRFARKKKKSVGFLRK